MQTTSKLHLFTFDDALIAIVAALGIGAASLYLTTPKPEQRLESMRRGLYSNSYTVVSNYLAARFPKQQQEPQPGVDVQPQQPSVQQPDLGQQPKVQAQPSPTIRYWQAQPTPCGQGISQYIDGYGQYYCLIQESK